MCNSTDDRKLIAKPLCATEHYKTLPFVSYSSAEHSALHTLKLLTGSIVCHYLRWVHANAKICAKKYFLDNFLRVGGGGFGVLFRSLTVYVCLYICEKLRLERNRLSLYLLLPNQLRMGKLIIPALVLRTFCLADPPSAEDFSYWSVWTSGSAHSCC